jgi:hypothetical protein
MGARQPLYLRLPEIYRIRDLEQNPPGQLEAYLSVIEEVYRGLQDNIEQLYHDFFIETCGDWVIPYLADLLGTSHLSGDPWTVRADVARTVRNRRRKGSLGAVESVVHALSGWAVHTVEMGERLVWNQHVNHQRPDSGGIAPLTLSPSISAAARGGTVTLRDPALLAFANGPFDPFAHVVDVKPPSLGVSGFNLPNLAVFLWRLEDYLTPVAKPCFRTIQSIPGAPAGFATRAVRFDLHPQGEPMVLFNTHRYHADDEPPNLTHEDAVPGPMPMARLTENTPTGKPSEYLAVATYAASPPAARPDAPGAEAVGLTLHLPDLPFAGTVWYFRGADLFGNTGWEACLRPALRENEIVIDPRRGRIVFGLAGANAGARATSLRDGLRVSPTYGFAGPTGAHPVQRKDAPARWLDQVPIRRTVDLHANPPQTLAQALANLHNLNAPLIVEIEDSLTHELDLSLVAGAAAEGGLTALRLNASLWIRAASGERPVIRLTRPLAFRPTDVLGVNAQALMDTLTVKLEGLYLTRASSFGATNALIERAALNRLEIEGCTLDPGGFRGVDGVRRPVRSAFRLDDTYGFTNAAEEDAFDQTPMIVLRRSLCGPAAMDEGYVLYLSGSIADAGSGVGAAAPALAVHAATGDPETGWGPQLALCEPEEGEPERDTEEDLCRARAGGGVTCLGRMRVAAATGRGGIFLHRFEVHDTLHGCLKFCYFSGAGDRLPQHHGCVFGPSVPIGFTAEIFGEPGYGQLLLTCDRRLLEEGPGNDEMGTFGYLHNAHRWKNIGIRLREYVPVGVHALLIPIT